MLIARRRSAERVFALLVGLTVVLLAEPRPCAAWFFKEHEEIGTYAFVEACRRVRERYGGTEARPGVRARVAIACRDVDVNAVIYGKANGTAGDRIDDPEDFMSSDGSFRATSRVHYFRLKIVNSSHFHPKNTRHWRAYHQKALRRALTASKQEGLDQIETLERAVYENALADHHLQDAYCAGHMGFNRPASSAGATLVFHDTWNAKGRAVRNRDGVSWRTYGDGHLRIPENAEGRRQVIAATALSIYDVLATFVEGKRSPEVELSIWRALPFTIEAPEVRNPVEALLAVLADRPRATGLEPLAAINQPARKDLSLEAWTLTTGPFTEERPLLGAMAGLSSSVPFLPTMAYGGLGGSRAHDEELLRLTAEVGLLRPLGLTNDGVVSHDVLGGFLWQAGLERFRGNLHVSYRITAELGRTMVRLQVGPSLRVGQLAFGYAVTFGIGYLLTAHGGGAI